jgi:hypothetical protein
MSDDRTEADKAWEARQEAARYRCHYASAKSASRSTRSGSGRFVRSWLGQAEANRRRRPRKSARS